MLTHPHTNLPYVPDIGHFLGGIDIYDLEETLGEELWMLNPNNENRGEIIRKYIIPHQSYLSYKHKYLLCRKLERALKDKDFSFSEFFGVDIDNHSATAWAASEIKTPRTFFEDIFQIASETWRLELAKAANEDMSAW